MTTIRLTLIAALFACVAWGQQVVREALARAKRAGRDEDAAALLERLRKMTGRGS